MASTTGPAGSAFEKTGLPKKNRPKWDGLIQQFSGQNIADKGVRKECSALKEPLVSLVYSPTPRRLSRLVFVQILHFDVPVVLQIGHVGPGAFWRSVPVQKHH